MPPPSDDRAALMLLCDCLRFDRGVADSGALSRRIAALGWDRLLGYADTQRLASVLVRAIGRLHLAPDVPPITFADGRMTLTRALQQREQDHLARRAELSLRLAEIAEALGTEGIVPIALKGGRSLVTGQPDWRHLRDIDLLVPSRQARNAQRIVYDLGYHEAEMLRPRLFHHHARELYRNDMPGWIEIHRRAGPSRVEQFLPTTELLRQAFIPKPGPGAGIAVLPPHLQVLHAMLHHHIGHRAVKLSEIQPKGLYEFAAEIQSLEPAERAALLRRAARHPRMLAVLELWLTAAADLFAMPALPEIAPADDVVAWWSVIRAVMMDDAAPDRSSEREKSASKHPRRMRRAAGGGNPIRRLVWRLTMPLTFAKRPVLPAFWQGRPPLSAPRGRAQQP